MKNEFFTFIYREMNSEQQKILIEKLTLAAKIINDTAETSKEQYVILSPQAENMYQEELKRLEYERERALLQKTRIKKLKRILNK